MGAAFECSGSADTIAFHALSAGNTLQPAMLAPGPGGGASTPGAASIRLPASVPGTPSTDPLPHAGNVKSRIAHPYRVRRARRGIAPPPFSIPGVARDDQTSGPAADRAQKKK